VEEWHTLGAPWRAAFELAWEAFGAGTIPVGAVVTDADGTVLARGRNRITESSAPERQIFGSRVAHAEINALVQLGMGRRYFDCTLWTTLEPCAQCIAAAWISTIGRVEFAAPDIYGGASKLIERQIEAADSVRNFPMDVAGPRAGPLAAFSELLHVNFFVDRLGDHPVAQTFRERLPDMVSLAERVRLGDHAAAELDDVLPRIWDELAAAARPPLQP
jgi:tRNA(Arg) A34 adenosine deaminase TadA